MEAFMPEFEPVTAPTEVSAPLAVNPSYVQSILIALVLAGVTVYGAISNMLIYFSTRDIAGFIVYLRSSDFLQVTSAITLIIGVGGMIYRTVRRKARELFLEKHVDNKVAFLKGTVEPVTFTDGSSIDTLRPNRSDRTSL
jgi:hypothetical protein